MNEKLFFEVIKYVIIFFVSILLPKKIIYFGRNLITYSFKVTFKYWFIYLTQIVLFFVLHFNKKKFLFDNYLHYRNLAILLMITFLVLITFQVFYIIFNKPKSFFTIYPTFTIKENEFIANDIQSEKINDIITKKIVFFEQKFYVYRNKKIQSKLEIIPAFLVIIIGLNGYKKLIQKKLNFKNPISIYFQKDILDSDLNIELFYDKKQFSNPNLFIELEFFTSIIEKSKSFSIESRIEDILHLYYFITSQSHLDLTIDFGLLDETFNILNDIEEQLPVLVENLKKYNFTDESLQEFYNSWKGIIKRYYSIIYIEKKDFKKAVDYIIDSNNINPYFPQSSYENAKIQYIAKYLSEMLPQVREAMEEFEVENYNKIQVDHLTKNYVSKLQYDNYKFNYHILIEIINRNTQDEDMLQYIEKKMTDNYSNCSNIFSLIFAAESLKYIPTLSGEKSNNIYTERIPKVIEFLEKAVNLDPEFELLHLRISSLKFLFAVGKEEIVMEEALEYTSKYIHLYNKYGLQ